MNEDTLGEQDRYPHEENRPPFELSAFKHDLQQKIAENLAASYALIEYSQSLCVEMRLLREEFQSRRVLHLPI